MGTAQNHGYSTNESQQNLIQQQQNRIQVNIDATSEKTNHSGSVRGKKKKKKRKQQQNQIQSV